MTQDACVLSDIMRKWKGKGSLMETLVKKSFNVSADLAQRIDEFMALNPQISFTLMMQEAIKFWMAKGGEIKLRRPTRDECDAHMQTFIKENSDLMDSLGG